jgi:hypothetical protein
MSKAIVVKKIPATNTKGAKLKATVWPNISVTIPYPYEDDSFRLAAEALQKKMGWDHEYDLIEGFLPNQDSVFVMVRREKGLAA